MKTVEGNAAVRYDHYSDFGSTTNPKFSVRWQPMSNFLVRTAWGSGFRAPALPELNTPTAITNTQAGLSDPIRCPVTNDAVQDCSTQFQQINGGNANLKPERSEQWTLGFVWDIAKGVSVAIDGFKINITDQVGVPVAGVILSDLARFGQYVVRGPVDPNFPNLPGPIQSILTTYANLGAARIIGADVDLRFRLPRSWAGDFKLGLNGTYYHKYDIQNADGSWTGQIGQSSGTLGAIQRWRHYATLDWDYGPWGATVAQNYSMGYTDQNPNLEGNPRKVGDYDVWDIQGRYNGFKNVRLAAGVKNVFNKAPPFTNQNFTFQTGYDPSYADPRGAFYYGSITYTFN
jgi:iron complex outermembrane receptor protein